MSTPHIKAQEGEIAELVLMPGDPLRAKYIAENFLDDYKLVNDVRNMYAYTGTYRGKRVTVFASGMGIPSIGIYAYELFKFYNVKKIIRIGTCGSFHKDIKVRDVVLSSGAYCKSYFPYLLNGEEVDFVNSNEELNNIVKESANKLNISLKYGKTITSDIFDLYCDSMDRFESIFSNDDYLACEMEAFGLFYLANKFNRQATCLMTVVDSKYDDSVLTTEEREKSLNEMITIALESI